MGSRKQRSGRVEESIAVYTEAQSSGGDWQPVVGPETLELMDYLKHSAKLSDAGAQDVVDEAVKIVSRCIPPKAGARTETGLVIGYVQSGKTMSFTTVAALARDNGFPLVIVITGISIPLFEQSRERLLKDLRLSTRRDRKWQHFQNPSPSTGEKESIAGTLEDWRDETVKDEERQAVLVTVMKTRKRLDDLTEVLSGIDLKDVSAVIIDDEADQARLNNLVKWGEQSATYRRLLELRNSLPRHTYLQYTATPQAPLLINLIDTLSPSFAEILIPGSEYVGGREFFVEHPELVRIIPPAEIPAADGTLLEPPATLLQALRIFFLGVAAGLLADGGQGNRSMMVHPSQQTLRHAEYLRWVTEIKQQWERLLELPENDPDRMDLEVDLRGAWEDLAATVEGLAPFEGLCGRLARGIRKTKVTEVNAVAGATPVVDWSTTYAHILVGGQAMDRGFTVEGLTVTYMPRGVGVGNADTVQQRARFFGYKRRYLGYCRVFLEAQVVGAYRHYVAHEEDVRERLLEHRDSGKPLAEWKRAFFLNSRLRPTRGSVLDLDYMQDNFADSWFTPGAPHDSAEAVRSNRSVVNAFVASLEFSENQGSDERTKAQRHLVVAGVPLADVYDRLLTRLRITRPTDSQQFTGLLLQIEAYMESRPGATCTIYQMGTDEGEHVRRRKVTEDEEIDNLFQGAHVFRGEAKPSVYPGDRAIRSPQELTIQIHRVTLHKGGGKVVAADVPTVAIWVPAAMSRHWLVQGDAQR